MTNPTFTTQAVAIARPIVQGFEGRVLTPYQDIGGVWTIGDGFTYLPALPGIPAPGAVTADTPALTDAQCDQVLDWWLAHIVHQIDGLVTVALNPNETAALIDFVYNLGPANLRRSTLRTMLNAGNFEQAAAQFPLWDEVDGLPNEAIRNRRLAEERLFLTPWAG